MKKAVVIAVLIIMVFGSAVLGAFIGGSFIYNRMNTESVAQQTPEVIEATQPVEQISCFIH